MLPSLAVPFLQQETWSTWSLLETISFSYVCCGVFDPWVTSVCGASNEQSGEVEMTIIWWNPCPQPSCYLIQWQKALTLLLQVVAPKSKKVRKVCVGGTSVLWYSCFCIIIYLLSCLSCSLTRSWSAWVALAKLYLVMMKRWTNSLVFGETWLCSLLKERLFYWRTLNLHRCSYSAY